MDQEVERSVLMVAPRWDYGDPSRGDSFEYENFGLAMSNIAPHVKFFDSTRLCGIAGEDQYRILMDELEDAKATVMFSMFFGDDIDPEALRQVRDTSLVPVVNWFCDDHWRYDSFSRVLAPSLTLSVTTDFGAAARYRTDGLRCLLSQWGVPGSRISALEPDASPRDRIAFVGQTYGRRESVLEDLERLIVPTNLAVYGYGTTNGRITVDEMYSLFNSSLASLNFADSWNPDPSIPRPSQLKARTFEVPGAGGVLITQSSAELHEYFNIGSEIFVADTTDEIVETVRFIRENPEDRLRMSIAGRQRVMDDHTIERRLEAVFAEIGV